MCPACERLGWAAAFFAACKKLRGGVTNARVLKAPAPSCSATERRFDSCMFEEGPGKRKKGTSRCLGIQVCGPPCVQDRASVFRRRWSPSLPA